jgi:hypothetical protein
LLGPSILLAGPPFCAGYAFHSWRRAEKSLAARGALALAIAELVTLLALMAFGAVAD